MDSLNLTTSTTLNSVDRFFEQYNLCITFRGDNWKGKDFEDCRLSEVSAEVKGGKMLLSKDMTIGDFLAEFTRQFGKEPKLKIKGTDDEPHRSWTIAEAKTEYVSMKEEAKAAAVKAQVTRAQTELVNAETEAKNAEFRRQQEKRKEEDERKRREEEAADIKRLGWKYYFSAKYWSRYLKPKYFIILGVILAFLIWRVIVNVAENHAKSVYTENVEAVLEAIEEEDAKGAMKMLKGIEQLKEGDAVKIFTAFCEGGYTKEAFKMYTEVHTPASCKDSYDYDYKKSGAAQLRKAAIENNDFETALPFYDSNGYDKAFPSASSFDAIEYYQYLEDCVLQMAKTGHKDEARRFINEKSTWFKTNVDDVNLQYNIEFKERHPGYTYAEVKNKLQAIVKEY